MSKSKKMPWLTLAIAFVFLCNPNITVIDPLPDFIGYIIISLALGRLAMLSSAMSEAKRAFEIMILIDASKLLAIFWIFGMEAISERTTSLLVGSFVFAVLEGIFLVSAIIKFFGGISEIGDFFPSQTIHKREAGQRLSITEKIRNYTCFFVIFKGAMTVLPELSVLSNSSTDEISYGASLYRYIGLMRFFCFIPVFVVGIIWLVKIIKYFSKLIKDKELNTALTDGYRQKEEQRKGFFIRTNVKTVSIFFIISALLTLDLRFEELNFLPDFLFIIPLIAAIAYIGKTVPFKKTAPKIWMALFAVASCVSFFFENYYNDNFTYNAMNKNETAFVFYLVYVVSVAVQGIVFICLLASVFKGIRKIVTEHTGYVKGKEINTEAEQLQIKAVHKELINGFTLAFDFAMLYVVSDVAFALYGAFYAFANVNLGFLNVINIGCGLLFVGMLQRAFSDLKEAVDTKYMLE